MHFKLSLVYIFTFALVLLGCNSALQTFKSGQKYFNQGEYDIAIQKLLPLSKQNQNSKEVDFYIAEAYRLSNRIAQATPFYEKTLAAGNSNADLLMHLAQSKQANGNYSEAQKYLQDYIAKETEKTNIDKANALIGTMDELNKISKVQKNISISSLSINTKGAEFAPFPMGSGLVFTSSRKSLYYKNNGLPFLGIYKVELASPIDVRVPELLSQNTNKENVNEGSAVFSKDGRVMIFARGNSGRENRDLSPNVDLYMSKLSEGVWSIPEMISVSDSAAWDGSPAFSNDGKALYFSSNRAGGFGGQDIYRANIDNSGRFGNAVNLGSKINTPGNEMFPYVSSTGKLFFSSDGHPTLGGLDIFSATKQKGEIQIEHQGLPLNSVGDDFGYIELDTAKGYFASNRPGGLGDDDIYFFQKPVVKVDPPVVVPQVVVKIDTLPTPKLVRYFLAGTILDEKNVLLDSVKVVIIDDATGQNISEQWTGKDGTFAKVKVLENKTYTILAEKKSYFTKRELFTMVGKSIPLQLLKKASTDTVFYANILLDKPSIGKEITKLFNIAPIYYNLDKSDIRSDASNELDRIVQVLVDNPTIKLELGSHTDCRATAVYNKNLSQRRAESAVKYIISKGISPARIIAKGYGESQLVNKCADGINCSEEEHQLNRRTEFKVIDIK